MIMDSKDNENIMHIIAIIIIASICLINIAELSYPAVLNDEFGYWANAASFAGYDWKALISETPYYSWGYSLWLVPIITLFPQKLWYKAAIIMNVIFLISSYVLCYKFGRKIFSKVKKELIVIVALTVTLYPSNIIYAQQTWSETLLYFLMWLVAYSIACLDEEFSYICFIMTALLLGYMYIVHARSIGVVLIGFIALLFIAIKHEKKWWLIAVPIIIFFVLNEFNDVIKNYLITEFYGNSSASNLNNVSLDTSTFQNYLMRFMNNIGLFIISLVGKWTYLMLATGMSIVLGIGCVLRELCVALKMKKIFENYAITKSWCAFSVLAMWGICSLQMLGWEQRKDIVVYSRYFEGAIGPLLFLSIMYLVTIMYKKNNWILLAGMVTLVGISFVCYFIENARLFFNTICSPVIGAFYRNMSSPQELYPKITGLCLGFVIMLLGANLAKKRKKYVQVVIVTFICSYLFIGYAGCYFVRDQRKILYDRVVSLKESLELEKKKQEIYYVKYDNDLYSANPKYLQFIMPDTKIQLYSGDEIESKAEQGAYILCHIEDKTMIENLQLNEKYEIVASTQSFKVFVTK